MSGRSRPSIRSCAMSSQRAKRSSNFALPLETAVYVAWIMKACAKRSRMARRVGSFFLHRFPQIVGSNLLPMSGDLYVGRGGRAVAPQDHSQPGHTLTADDTHLNVLIASAARDHGDYPALREDELRTRSDSEIPGLVWPQAPRATDAAPVKRGPPASAPEEGDFGIRLVFDREPWSALSPKGKSTVASLSRWRPRRLPAIPTSYALMGVKSNSVCCWLRFFSVMLDNAKLHFGPSINESRPQKDC